MTSETETVIKLIIISKDFFQKMLFIYLYLKGDYLLPGCPQIFFYFSFSKDEIIYFQKNLQAPSSILNYKMIKYYLHFINTILYLIK